MKKLLSILIFTLLSSVISMANGNGKHVEVPSGVYLDGEILVPLCSAFSGGAIADPMKGSSFRMRLYSDLLATPPKWNEKRETVYLGGFKYVDRDYSSTPGGYINEIILTDVKGGIGNLYISLKQGKLENNDPSVASVKFLNFDPNSFVHIIITLKSGKKIDIIFRGESPYDGYY